MTVLPVAPRASRSRATLPAPALVVALTLVVLAMVTTLLASAPADGAVATAAPTAASAPRDPSLDLPKPPKRCLLPNGSISPEVRPCWITTPRRNRPTVVLWGDSHAVQMLPAVQKAVRGRGVNLAMFSIGACPPMKFGRSRDVCKDFNADALRFVSRLQKRGQPVRVILGANWQGYRTLHRQLFVTQQQDPGEIVDWVVEIARVFPTRAPALVRTLGRKGVHVDLIGETATVPARGLKRCRAGEEPFACNLPRRKALPQEAATRQWLRGIMRPLPRGARLIEVNSAFCNARLCAGRTNGIFTFYNDLHVSATRAKTLTRFFTPSVRRLRAQNR